MYDIVCCIIFGFFMIIGISNTIYFLIKNFFKFDKLDNQILDKENAEYIIRSSKYCNINYKIHDKTDKEIKFICDKLNTT